MSNEEKKGPYLHVSVSKLSIPLLYLSVIVILHYFTTFLKYILVTGRAFFPHYVLFWEYFEYSWILHIHLYFINSHKKPVAGGFPGGAVVKNPPDNAGDTG